jgi:hypothetical protein
MVVSISIPDDLWEVYVAQNPQNPHRAIVKQLKRFKDVSPADRVVALTGDDLAEVQRISGRQIETVKDLRRLVEDALTLKSDGIKVKITDGQRARIKHEAAFFNRDPEELASEKLEEALHARFGV